MGEKTWITPLIPILNGTCEPQNDGLWTTSQAPIRKKN
jgi:hypothetical protein